MTERVEKAFGAYVVEAAFLDDTAVFALGDGTVRRLTGDDEDTTTVHAGAILAAERSRDGRSLVTGGDDGLVARITADGTVAAVAERKGKWIDQIATGPDDAVAFASGRRAEVRLGDGRERAFDLPRAVGGVAFAEGAAPRGRPL